MVHINEQEKVNLFLQLLQDVTNILQHPYFIYLINTLAHVLTAVPDIPKSAAHNVAASSNLEFVYGLKILLSIQIAH